MHSGRRRAHSKSLDSWLKSPKHLAARAAGRESGKQLENRKGDFSRPAARGSQSAPAPIAARARVRACLETQRKAPERREAEPSSRPASACEAARESSSYYRRDASGSIVFPPKPA